MTGSMGRTSLAEAPPSDTTLLFAERNAWRKIREMVHQGTTLSDALKNIRGDFLFWQREVYEHLNRAPEKGKNKGKAPKVWQTQWEKPKKGGKGAWPSGPTRSKPKGQLPLSSMAGPLGFQESQRGGVLQKSSPPQQVLGIVRPARSGRMGGCVMPPHRSMRHRHALTFPSDRRPSGCHRLRGFPVSVGITGHQCERAHRLAIPTRATAEGRQSGDGLRWGGTSPGCHRPRKPLHQRRGAAPARALQKGGSIPFPRTHRGSGKTPPERPRGRSRPARARAQGKHQDRGQMTGGSDKGHTESLGGASPTFPWMQDIPERLRLRLGADADRRKGGDLGQDPYSTMCSSGGQGRIGGRWKNCRTGGIVRWFPKLGGPPPVRGRAEQTLWGLEDLEPRVMEDTDNDSVLAYKGLGQLTAPQVGSSFLEHPMDPIEPERSEVLIDLGHAGLRSMGKGTPPLPHQVR